MKASQLRPSLPTRILVLMMLFLGCSSDRKGATSPTAPTSRSELPRLSTSEGTPHLTKPEEEVFGSVFIMGQRVSPGDAIYYVRMTKTEDPGHNIDDFEAPEIVYVDPDVTTENQWGWYAKNFDVPAQNMNRGRCDPGLGAAEGDIEVHRTFDHETGWREPLPTQQEAHCIGPGLSRAEPRHCSPLA